MQKEENIKTIKSISKNFLQENKEVIVLSIPEMTSQTYFR